jgi:hypothetical protein
MLAAIIILPEGILQNAYFSEMKKKMKIFWNEIMHFCCYHLNDHGLVWTKHVYWEENVRKNRFFLNFHFKL